jgi:hypothetical protein
MKVTIHQPNYIPWIGFFNKVSMADTYVILDTVQYEKDGFTNRNKIRQPDSPIGWAWLTVPVKKGSSNQPIKDVQIDNNQKWKEASLRSINRIYKSSPYLKAYSQFLDSIYKKEWDGLSDLNEFIIKELFSMLGIEPQIIKASELGVNSKKSDLNLDICKKVGATEYISGISGRDYLEMDRFKEEGIKVTFHDFKHPVYEQVRGPFISNLSVLDLLLSCGPDSTKMIKNTIVSDAFPLVQSSRV